MKKDERSEKKVRCAFLITELAPGGAEKALFHLVSNLDRERFEPVVYSLSGRPSDVEKSLVPLFKANGIETIELGLRGARDLSRVVARLRADWKKRRPHLVQTFMFHANVLGRFVARAAGVPLVCCGLRVAERDAPNRLRLDRWTGGLVDVWVAVGESTREFSQTVGRLPGERLVSIPNGVKTREIEGVVRVMASGDGLLDARREPNPIEPSTGRKRLVAIGRLVRQKGFDLLLESAATWLKSEVADEWELWIVGDGEERERLIEQRERLGLENNVVFAGWRADASEILARSEIFLLSSRWEGMPNVLLEAAALGKPSLCANVEGVKEILGENAEPQTYPLGDFQVQRDKALALIANKKLREELGQKNRERVLKYFTVEKTAERYEELWLKLLRKKGIRFDFDS